MLGATPHKITVRSLLRPMGPESELVVLRGSGVLSPGARVQTRWPKGMIDLGHFWCVKIFGSGAPPPPSSNTALTRVLGLQPNSTGAGRQPQGPRSDMPPQRSWARARGPRPDRVGPVRGPAGPCQAPVVRPATV